MKRKDHDGVASGTYGLMELVIYTTRWREPVIKRSAPSDCTLGGSPPLLRSRFGDVARIVPEGLLGSPIHSEDVVWCHIRIAIVVLVRPVVGVDRITAGLAKGIVLQAKS